MTYAEQLKHCSFDEAVEIILDRLETELVLRNEGHPQSIVRDALVAFFRRGVDAGVDAELVIIKNEVIACIQGRDAARRAGTLNPVFAEQALEPNSGDVTPMGLTRLSRTIARQSMLIEW